MQIDPAAISEAFASDGAVMVEALFEPALIRQLVNEFDQTVAQLRATGTDSNARWDSAVDFADGANTEILHTHQVQRFSAGWLPALLHPKFLAAARAILGPDVVLHHTKLFLKPPATGAPFPMHQDWRYFPTEDDSMIAAVIHLTDATEEMGCIRTFPGSHRLGRQPSTSGRPLWDDPTAFAAFVDEYPSERATPHHARAGDVLFFHNFTVHGSGPNLSSVPRKTLLVQLFSGRDRLDPISDHPVDGLVLSGRNHYANRHSVTERSAAAAARRTVDDGG